MDKQIIKCRWAALSLGLVMLALSLLPINGYGATAHCSIGVRLLYPLLHASLIHCIMNVWCLLSVVFYYDLPPWYLVAAYLIAVFVPSCFLSPTIPTVGFSGVCFALFGLSTFKVARRMYFTSWVMTFILVGFIIPGINAWVHLFCYVAGWLVGLITTPICLWMR